MTPPPSSSSSSSSHYSLFHLFHRSNPFSLQLLHSHNLNMPPHDPFSSFPFSSFALFAAFSLFSLTFLSFSLYKRFSKTEKHAPQLQDRCPTRNPGSNDPATADNHSPPRVDGEFPRPGEDAPIHLKSSVFVEVLPSDSAKWASLFGDPDSIREDPGAEQRGKKKRRKAKKKKTNNSGCEEKGGGESEGANSGSGHGVRFDSGCLYPFTSSSSAMQRKIKLQYDELVKCNDSKKLSLPQVVQFANSLVDARNELQHKADVIQRKFVIAKALLCKADRSSFDRLRQQIYKLELEQKRLEEDAFVYNSLQQQLKLSQAYQKMLEVGACMEKEKSRERRENREDDEFADISFEELLAQEKKDSFWQKNGKSRVCSS